MGSLSAQLSSVDFLFAGLFCLAVVAVLLADAAESSNSWWPKPFWGEADPGPWCEHDRGSNSFLRERCNALTDLSFLGCALWMQRCGLVDSETKEELSLRHFPGRSLLCGALNLLHFLGTFSNHACRCHTGHVLDVLGMVRRRRKRTRASSFTYLSLLFCSFRYFLSSPCTKSAQS